MRSILAFLLIAHYSMLLSQVDSIMVNNKWRTYLYTIPVTHSINQETGLVINMHGLNSNASAQKIYSEFDKIAEKENFIMIYPNAIDGQWNLFNDDDVVFIDLVIQKFRSDYAYGACLFITGISYGGFMTYKLACDRDDITAIASVAGNMTEFLQDECEPKRGLPVMHFHGTEDAFVNFNGVPLIIPPVENTIAWWVKKNECENIPKVITIPNLETNDKTSVHQYEYVNGINKSQVTFYKITNGGHTWPGASLDILPLGITTKDINASQLIGQFFRQACNVTKVSIAKSDGQNFEISPNPANEVINIELQSEDYSIKVTSQLGQEMLQKNHCKSYITIDTQSLPSGIYTIQLLSNEVNITRQILIAH